MKNRALLIVLPVAIVVTFLVVLLAGSEPAVNKVTKSPLLGKAAPDVVGTLVSTGVPYRLVYRPGRWTVVNFFASWCKQCVDEHNEFLKFSQAHKPSEVELVSVLFDDRVADAKKFFAEHGGTWPVILDDGQVSTDYGVAAVPETFLIAPDGTVVVKYVGTISADGLERAITQIVNESNRASVASSAP